MTAPRSPQQPVYAGYVADPFVLAHDGVYYGYGTGPAVHGSVFPVLRSEDLTHWTAQGGALEPLGPEAGHEYWAPEVAFRDGAFHMYFSVGHGPGAHQLRVAVAERPQGPFRDAGVRLTPFEPFAIDPHPFFDGEDWYLFFAKDFLDGERVGTGLAVDRMVGPHALAGEARTVVRANGDWQLYQRERRLYGGVHDWHTVEGPFVVKRAGRYYCFFSGGNWQNESYGLSFAVAEHPLGPWREPHPGGPALLGTRPGGLVGPGHASITTGPDGHDRLVFHAWNEDRSRRQMHVAHLVWTANGPRVPGAG